MIFSAEWTTHRDQIFERKEKPDCDGGHHNAFNDGKVEIHSDTA